MTSSKCLVCLEYTDLKTGNCGTAAEWLNL
jgi:hypothetical protein